MMVKIETEAEKFQTFKLENIHRKHEKQQKIFSAEQKRADMRNAFYHMAVWNVQEAGDLIKEIIEENDKKGGGKKVKPISVAEKVRHKAAELRRNERIKNGSETRGHELNNPEVVMEEFERE
jgi:hypothetical protein